MANIDWVVAISLFIIFVTWAFGYFSSLAAVKSDELKGIIDVINNKIMDYITAEEVTVPISHYALIGTEDTVLFFQYNWTFGKNTTRIFSDSGVEKDCTIINNTVYFRTSLVSNDNFFTMVYHNEELPEPKCSGTFFLGVNESSSLLIEERSRLVSQERINNMTNTSFSAFRDVLNVRRDFRIEIEKASGNVTFGPSQPLTSNVFVKETISGLLETKEGVKIRVLLW